jgi:uncharacterized membrane protein YphA (DoxX/SURF4 family)
VRLSHIPLRLATGAFILNSGISKRHLDEEAAAGLQGMAANAFPRFKDVSPATFGTATSAGEMALGAALLLPFVSPVAAGAALTAFAAGLLRMYTKTPGMTEGGSVRPTRQGTPVAKDVWMLGVGAALVIDGLTDGARHTAKAAKKRLTT